MSTPPLSPYQIADRLVVKLRLEPEEEKLLIYSSTGYRYHLHQTTQHRVIMASSKKPTTAKATPKKAATTKAQATSKKAAATKAKATPKTTAKAKAKATPKTAAKATKATSTPEAAPVSTAAATEAPKAAASFFAGKTVVLTGTLMTMKRTDAQKLLATAGAKFGDGVTKQTDILIYGEKAGSKLAAARKLNITMMTEAEMVAKLSQSSSDPSAVSEVAKKLAVAEAEEKTRMAGFRAELDATNAQHLKDYGMTAAQLLMKYVQVFSKRPDVYVTNNKLGGAASNDTLLRHRGKIPSEWLAFHAELGAVHFGWILAVYKKDIKGHSEGYRGGRIDIGDPNQFRWWPIQAWAKKYYKFKEDATFDNFVAEGRTMLSYNPKEKPHQATLIFDNANDCVRHDLGMGIFEYLRKGASVGFSWYWQMGDWEGTEFTVALMEESLPASTPAKEVDALLQKQGLTAKEAEGLRKWLGGKVNILLHQSLTSEGAAQAKLARRFPGINRGTKRTIDLALVKKLSTSGAGIKDKEWKALLSGHKEFLGSGGDGGYFELLQVAGLPLCIYQGATATKGKQLVLRLKNAKGQSAKKANLSYADLSGSYCEGVDFSGADLSHSILTDAIFVNANFSGAKLEGTDFSGSKLHGANFQKAELEGTDFEGADLTGADLSKTDTSKAKFPGAIVKDVKG